jgi:hypothetical protein
MGSMLGMRSPLAPLTLCLFASLAPAAQVSEALQDAKSGPEAAELERPLARAVVAGASVSDGFGLGKELDTSVKLAHVFEAVCLKEGADFTPLGDSRFFMDPRGAGKRIIDASLEADATCFIGIDFLFWYAYGSKSEARRLQHLELALSELERLECPVLIGDMPDMSMALDGGYMGRPLITKEMVPSEETLLLLNKRLKAWVMEHSNAQIIPLAMMLGKIRSGETIELRGLRYEPEELPTLLQTDNLHLTTIGSIALCLLTADLLVIDQESLTQADFIFDRARAAARLKEIATRVKEEELVAREARKERRRLDREERRKAREREKESEKQQPKD